MKRLFTFALAAASLFAAGAQTTQKITATKANEYGIIYTLPNTVLDITVETETTVKEPGEFFKYAKKYLNVDNPIDKKSVNTTVKSVTVNSRGVANPEERYIVTFKPGVSPFVVINSENLPLAINSEKFLKQTEIELPTPQKAEPTPLQTSAAQQVISEEMLQSQSSAKRAELAAAQIYQLRQYRSELLTGQSDAMPPDGNALKIVLDNINAQEAALVAMFVGTTQTYTDVKSMTYTPEEEVTDEIIARVSAIDGIVAPDDLSGAPLMLTMKITERGEMPVDDKGITVPFPKNGFAYRIPGKIEVAIKYDGEEVFRSQFRTAQFGVTYGLNPNSFTDKKEPIYLIFDPVTGTAAEIGAAQ
ncbi:MAG: DUF4831 family protein [Muribaculaceae bacterium]